MYVHVFQCSQWLLEAVWTLRRESIIVQFDTFILTLYSFVQICQVTDCYCELWYTYVHVYSYATLPTGFFFLTHTCVARELRQSLNFGNQRCEGWRLTWQASPPRNKKYTHLRCIFCILSYFFKSQGGGTWGKCPLFPSPLSPK